MLLTFPILHSNPSASVKLFLDFDGHFEPDYNGIINITTQAYDIDGDVTAFSDTELENIETIWAMVAEDFAPFNIDVTTEEPGVLAEGTPIDDANGIALRVAIGTSIDESGGTIGNGVHYNTFTNEIANVAYITGGSTPAAGGNLSSHEAGHGFGLGHQSVFDENGVKTDEYNRGDGSWTPLMGISASSSAIVTTWHDGSSSPAAPYFQDDMAMLAGATNGFGYRTDDHADSIAAPTALSTDGSTWSGAGIIETNDDVDVFSFTVTTEDTYRIGGDVAAVGANLDMVLELRDSAGNLIASADPQETVNAELVEHLLPGDYFVGITKSATYGWIGQYTVNIDAPPAGITASSVSVPLTTGEDGRTTTFDVALDTRPTADVTVSVSSSDLEEGTVSVSSLTFTPTNWNVQQMVTVTGVDDDVVDGSAGYSIVLGPATSADAEYNGLDPADVSTVNIDNDAPGWAFSIGGTVISAQRGAINVDADGNIYVLAVFKGTVDFDPGPGTFELTDRGGTNGDAAIAKYTSDGQLLWAQSFGGDNTERVKAIEFDAAGNVYITGYSYSTTIEFGNITLTNAGSADAYVAKLDASGNFLWAHNFGGINEDVGLDLSVNDAGEVFLAGGFAGQVDFDPDPGNAVTLTSAGEKDSVVWKLDSNGNFQWVQSFGAAGNDVAMRLATDDSGNIYVIGTFEETVDFGTDIFTSASPDKVDTFVLKLDSLGDTVWARHVSGAGSIGSTRLAVSASGSIYTAGSFDGTADFVGTATSMTSTPTRDTYVAKWNSDGTLSWARQISGTSQLVAQNLVADAEDNVFIAGHFKGTVDFDPSVAGAFNLTAPNDRRDGFLVQLDGAGNFVETYHATGSDHLRTEDVAVGADGNIYSIGSFLGTLSLPTGDVLTTGALRDTYVLKLTMAPGIRVSPTTGLTTSEAGGTATFNVVLDTPPTADVTIGLTSSDTGEGTISPTSLTFTTENWNVAQTVTVTGVDDAVLDGEVDFTIVTAAATSNDPGYNGLNANDVTVTNLDNDVPPLAASDGFETGNFSGGSGWATGWIVSGDAGVRSQDAPHSGNYHTRLRRNTGDLIRSVDTTGLSAVTLSFWGKLKSFESSDKAWVEVSPDGTNWTTLREFVNGEDDNQYHLYEFEVSVSGDALYIRFDSGMSGSNDYWYIDDVQVVASGPANTPPLAVNDVGYSVDEDGVLSVAAAGVLANDSDADDDPLTAVLVSGTTSGSLTLSANGSFTYSPNSNFNGSDSFTYRANDGTTDSNSATVSITVNSINDAPVANDQSVSAKENTAKPVTLTASDVDNGSLTYSIVSGSTNGTLSGTGANLSYTPDTGFTGADSFTFQANDGNVNSNVATVSIIVAANNSPVANAQLVSLAEDSSKSINLTGSDPDGDSITYSLVSGPSYGSLSGTVPNLTYTPNANFNGSDSFTFKVNDGIDDSLPAIVSVTDTSLNDAPVANAQSASTNEDTPVAVILTGSDIDGDSLTYIIVSGPSNGSLSGTASNLTDTPGANFNGSDSYTFKVNDGSVDSNIATVSITISAVNDAPVAVGDGYTVNQDSTLNVAAAGVLGNDGDVDGDTLTVALYSSPSHGTLTLNSNGAFTYTPNTGFTGADSFTYRANDGTVTSNIATVSITVSAPASTKFFVVDSGADKTFEYQADGTALTNDAWNLSTSNTSPKGATSITDGSKVWIIDNNDRVYVYDGNGELQTSWIAGGLNRAEGIATDGTDIWILDKRAKKILRYDNSATTGDTGVDFSFSLNGANNKAKGITTDGTSVWVVNDDKNTDKVFKYDTSNGALLGSWTIDSANSKPTGLTIDPSGSSTSIWIVDSGSDRVYEYSNALGNSGGSLVGNFSLASGNTNPQGIADPPPNTVGSASTALLIESPQAIPQIDSGGRSNIFAVGLASDEATSTRESNLDDFVVRVDLAQQTTLPDKSNMNAGLSVDTRPVLEPTDGGSAIDNEVYDDLFSHFEDKLVDDMSV